MAANKLDVILPPDADLELMDEPEFMRDLNLLAWLSSMLPYGVMIASGETAISENEYNLVFVDKNTKMLYMPLKHNDGTGFKKFFHNSNGFPTTDFTPRIVRKMYMRLKRKQMSFNYCKAIEL
jgi:hypothetical protein